MKLGKAAAALLAVGLAGGLVIGCTPGKTDGSPEGAPAADKPKGEGRGGISVSVLDTGLVPAEEGTLENNRWTKWINEQLPFQVDFVAIPNSDQVQKYNTLFASSSAPDLIFSGNAEFRNQLYSQKQLLPLDELIEQHSTAYKNLLKQYPLLREAGVKPDGKLYEFGFVGSFEAGDAMLIRADWLKKLNLPVPKTAEELFAVAKAFTENDPNGTGRKDTKGIMLSSTGGSNIDAMFQNAVWVVENGKMVRDRERAKEAAAFKKRLYDAGVADKDFLTDKTGDKAKQDWINGKLGIYGASMKARAFNEFESLKKNNPDAEVIAIALPSTKYGQFSPNVVSPISMRGVVNIKTKDPVSVIQYMDFMVEEGALTVKYGLENEHYRINANGCRETTDRNKFMKEVNYTQFFWAYTLNRQAEKECGQRMNQYDPDKPLEKAFIDLLKQANALYLTQERPVPTVTVSDFMPTLPKELQMIVSGVSANINDLWAKAIVSGPGYTVEQAAADAEKLWLSAGGEKVEQFYHQWYEENQTKIKTNNDSLYNSNFY